MAKLNYSYKITLQYRNISGTTSEITCLLYEHMLYTYTDDVHTCT